MHERSDQILSKQEADGWLSHHGRVCSYVMPASGLSWQSRIFQNRAALKYGLVSTQYSTVQEVCM